MSKSPPIQLTRTRGQDDRSKVISEIQTMLDAREQSLKEAIDDRDLYFRISVVGTCNLSCAFCHNEGAPTRGKISLSTVEAAILDAVKVGFSRIQFTGGEPLLRPDIADFVALAREYVSDVGITTNGIYLPSRLGDLIASGLRRLHVSLQTEPLEAAGSNGQWGIPEWLIPTVQRASELDEFSVRLNLPVPADCLDRAEAFLYLITRQGVDVKVFSVLPEGRYKEGDYPLSRLEEIVASVNGTNAGEQGIGTVLLRGFRPPSGLRCGVCPERERCKEQSHSLRLGADLQLRPCLATREWDSTFNPDLSPLATLREATMLALDYQW